jgi:ADP-ribosyl-[dinitrogen reductase] hydrolase
LLAFTISKAAPPQLLGPNGGGDVRTSKSDPLQIAEVMVDGCDGVIGITFCPGKHDWFGDWARNLDADLDDIRNWGAQAVVTLIEEHEFDLLRVRDLPDGVTGRGMSWHHLPIRDVSTPNAMFEEQWETVGEELCRRLRGGERVLVHCRGGLGRAGTIAARLLVDLGMDPDEAIAAVRRVRPGAMEVPEQEAYVRNRAWRTRSTG